MANQIANLICKFPTENVTFQRNVKQRKRNFFVDGQNGISNLLSTIAERKFHHQGCLIDGLAMHRKANSWQMVCD
jgi:hypothetical protein